MEFVSSPQSTLGIELELGIVDRQTRSLQPYSVDLLAEVGRPHGGAHPKAKHELYQSSVEAITGICDTVADAQRDLATTLAELTAVLEPKGMALIGGGLHPLAMWEDLIVSPGERYAHLANTIGWPARRVIAHGVHFHVGVRSGDEAVAITNSMASYLPCLLALSASSPFYRGTDTALASTRTKIFEAMPGGGLPATISDWADFDLLLAAMQQAGSVQTIREVWWDVRPHPDFGTVEMRMCDMPTNLREVGALAAFAQCLVHDIGRRFRASIPLPNLPEWARRDNKWRAARWGLEAEIIIDDNGILEPVTHVIKRVLRDLEPVAQQLGCAAQLAEIPSIIEYGASYVRQREAARQPDGLVAVVDQLLSELATDHPTGWPTPGPGY